MNFMLYNVQGYGEYKPVFMLRNTIDFFLKAAW